MTLLILAAASIGAGLLTILLAAERRRLALLVGLGGAIAVFLLALAMPQEESLELGGVGLVSTPLVRSLAVAWSAGLALLALLEAGIGSRPAIVGPSLIGLAVAGVALATKDPASSFAALAAGGVAGVAVPSLSGWLDGPDAPSRLPTASRGSLAILASGLLGLAVVAWGASAAGPLGGVGPVTEAPDGQLALGAALLVIAAAVAIRCGLIPLHVWAARFMEGVTPLAVPAAFAWGSAAFILVALDWSQVALGPSTADGPEGIAIIALGLTSVILGGLAAMVHDDVEHVLGYSILQDAGIAILAFASLQPEIAAAARNWLVASATVKTALAAWAAVVRATYGGHRLADLGGWARHSPVLGVAFGAILLVAVGVPGMALYDARSQLVHATMPVLGTIATLAFAAMPAIYLGRIAVAGVAPIGPAVASGPSGRPTWSGGRAPGWSSSPVTQLIGAIPAEVRHNRIPLLSLGVLVLSAIALVTAIYGAGG